MNQLIPIISPVVPPIDPVTELIDILANIVEIDGISVVDPERVTNCEIIVKRKFPNGSQISSISKKVISKIS